ncbi:Zinc finger CCCH domain-containing protein 4, partial [Frankliniella fusca]
IPAPLGGASLATRPCSAGQQADGLGVPQDRWQQGLPQGWQQGWQDLQRLQRSSQDEAEREAARGPHQPNGDLDRVQDMFPFDLLLLYDDNPLALKAKGLMSRRNSPASKLSRALSTKTVGRTAAPEDVHGADRPGADRLQPSPGGGAGQPAPGGGGPGGGGAGGDMVPPAHPPPQPRMLRQFIMEAPAQFT